MQKVSLDTHPFWKDQKNWIDRIFKLLKEKPSENKIEIRPFAIEICPWGSKSFQTLKIDDELMIVKYMNQYVFDVIEKVYQKFKTSKINLVLYWKGLLRYF